MSAVKVTVLAYTVPAKLAKVEDVKRRRLTLEWVVRQACGFQFYLIAKVVAWRGVCCWVEDVCVVVFYFNVDGEYFN